MMLAAPGCAVDPSNMGDRRHCKSSLRMTREPYGASDHSRHALDPPRR